ncbi:hypothetical protein PQO00_09825 [Flavivirga sp. 57AJ16]|nr:hypothetical protein [Flavivirga sp. 57AJ16]
MEHIKENIPTTKQLLFMVSITILMASCNNKKTNDTSYDYVHTKIKAVSSLIGEWKLDSVVFMNDKIRGKQQIPFSTTTWSFTDKGEYMVKIQQNQYDVTILEDSIERKTSLTTEIPYSEMKGNYKHSNQELITNILGGNTKYTIVEQSDSQLQLSSQRIHIPPN